MKIRQRDRLSTRKGWHPFQLLANRCNIRADNMALLAFGLNHTTAPLEVREKVTFDEAMVCDALNELTGEKGIDEAAILSTCNRTEIYCAPERS